MHVSWIVICILGKNTGWIYFAKVEFWMDISCEGRIWDY